MRDWEVQQAVNDARDAKDTARQAMDYVKGQDFISRGELSNSYIFDNMYVDPSGQFMVNILDGLRQQGVYDLTHDAVFAEKLAEVLSQNLPRLIENNTTMQWHFQEAFKQYMPTFIKEQFTAEGKLAILQKEVSNFTLEG